MLIFNVGQLSRQLGVHRNTLTNWVKSGKLPAKASAAKKYAISKDAFITFCDQMNIPKETVSQLITHLENNTNGDRHTSLRHPAESTLPSNHIPNHPLDPLNPKQKEQFMTKKHLGSVMVVGGGIAGIQASLDLADSGYYVYLLEKSAGIGGAMAQLDKTFPTNDCAM